MLIVIDLDPSDVTGDFGADRDDIGLDKGIIGGFIGKSVEIVAHTEYDTGEDRGDYDQETGVLSIPWAGLVCGIRFVIRLVWSMPGSGQWMGPLRLGSPLRHRISLLPSGSAAILTGGFGPLFAQCGPGTFRQMGNRACLFRGTRGFFDVTARRSALLCCCHISSLAILRVVDHSPPHNMLSAGPIHSPNYSICAYALDVTKALNNNIRSSFVPSFAPFI
jgi:hypothetical protein